MTKISKHAMNDDCIM